MRRLPLVASALTLMALVGAACVVPAAPPGPAPVSQAQSPAPARYDPTTAFLEVYWYSRHNLGHLVMRSGMGVQFTPPKGVVRAMMEKAGLSQGPKNPYRVQALFRSGDPHFIRAFNGDEQDFANLRWDPAKMDRTVTPQALGYTMVKEVIWSKSFASHVEGPVPMNHFRALVLSAEAAAQARFAQDHLMSPEGLFAGGWRDSQVTDATISPLDQVVMLWALSELADYASGSYGWYGAPLSGDQAHALADSLLTDIHRYAQDRPGFLTDMPSRDLGVALSALSADASYTRTPPGGT